MRDLAHAGLTTREACGNTVRNMTACPMAGACPKERTDINQHLEHAARYFLRNPLNQQMPRKFKISFSACESDCAQGLLHDLGVVATVKDGEPGFKILAGGGLGHKPREAIVVRAFVPEHELIPAMEAVIELHNTHSDRTKRAKSRIKFLVERFGADGFRLRFDEAFARARAAHAARDHLKAEWLVPYEGPAPGPGAPRAPFAQRQRGLVTVPVSRAARPGVARTVDRAGGAAAPSWAGRDPHRAGPEPRDPQCSGRRRRRGRCGHRGARPRVAATRRQRGRVPGHQHLPARHHREP